MASVPRFSYGVTHVKLYKNNYVIFIAATDIHVETWSINKELPGNLTFSYSTGRISGTPYDLMENTTFTITASNNVGNFAYDLTIEVVPDTQSEDCELEGKVLLGVTTTVASYPDRIGYEVMDENERIVASRYQGTFESDTVYSFKKCVAQGHYSLKIIDYSNSGWGTGTFVEIFAFTTHIGRYTMNSGDGNKEVTLACIYILYFSNI